MFSVSYTSWASQNPDLLILNLSVPAMEVRYVVGHNRNCKEVLEVVNQCELLEQLIPPLLNNHLGIIENLQSTSKLPSKSFVVDQIDLLS
jgi:hypothetical protein